MTTLRTMVYDAGALIAAERNQSAFWRMHRAYLTAGGVPVVPSPVVAQVWRNGARQAALARLLQGCDVLPLDDALARRVGELLGHADVVGPVEGAVALISARTSATVITSDPGDIQRLLDHLGRTGKRATVKSLY
ncbi:type II toxin-antitoxin system VapC family toxin [Streptomyces sp. NPDC057116]|uniref:type II toxin-antitoxin system VapC family toxin n=1 Tax=Streptomyces sp. NPDC057116 TaxID=3346023 RepID=UPI00363B7DD1